tara:strand:- start:346 stop:513 length:168 start_codon:yes stop_codon:yes gene_type:complete
MAGKQIIAMEIATPSLRTIADGNEVERTHVDRLGRFERLDLARRRKMAASAQFVG